MEYSFSAELTRSVCLMTVRRFLIGTRRLGRQRPWPVTGHLFVWAEEDHEQAVRVACLSVSQPV
jgi:hypothetical protein